MKFDLREKAVFFIGTCFVVSVLWYMFLYTPKKTDLENIREKQKLVQAQYNQLLKNYSLAMSGSAEKLEISRKCVDILDNLPYKEDIGSVLSQVKEISITKDIRIISINPHNLSLCKNHDPDRKSQVEKISLDIILEGRFINMGQYLLDLVKLAFFAGYSKIGIETSEEIYPETKARITCILLFLNKSA